MKEVLVTVKTYPEISKKHRETVCTAGILRDTKTLVRLYPIRFRYLKDEQQFLKYQWITVDLEKNYSDPRPESYRVTPDSLKAAKVIGTKDQWVERCEWVLNENNIFGSVEELKACEKEDRTSLGMVRPKAVFDVIIKEKTAEEIEGFQRKQQVVYQQIELFERDVNEVDIIPYRFFLKFECDNVACKGHEMSILDWEIVQLYRRLRHQHNWQSKIKSKIMDEIFSVKKETYLYLGNMALHRNIFCILGFFYPPKDRQPSLF